MAPVRTNTHSLVLGCLIVASLTFFMGRNGLFMPRPRSFAILDLVVSNLRWGLVYIALFIAGHLALQKRGIGPLPVYMTLGAICCLASLAIAMPGHRYELLIARGQLVWFGLWALVWGALVAALYHRRATAVYPQTEPAPAA